MPYPRTLTLEHGMQYGSYTNNATGEHWICSPHNGAPLMRCSSDVQYILHLLNTGKYSVQVTEATRQCTTTKGYYQVWVYSIV